MYMNPQRVRERVQVSGACVYPVLCYGVPSSEEASEGGLGALGQTPERPETTWTTTQKVAGIGLGAVVVIGLAAFALRPSRCGKLQRWYEYAIRAGGPKDYEASLLRSEAGSRGCAWAKAIEDREEQDRYWATRTVR